jgi:hypothetical protein
MGVGLPDNAGLYRPEIVRMTADKRAEWAHSKRLSSRGCDLSTRFLAFDMDLRHAGSASVEMLVPCLHRR